MKRIWDIECPFCQKPMSIRKQEAALNEKTGAHFIKTRYNCPSCDFWLTSEIPRRIALRHVQSESSLPAPVEEPPIQRIAS